jgi:hypothetical protein
VRIQFFVYLCIIRQHSFDFLFSIFNFVYNVVRLEKYLGKLVSETVSKFTNLKGRKKYEYLHERVKVLFLCDETCTLKEIQIQERNRLETELNSRVHELYVKIANLPFSLTGRYRLALNHS